MLDRYSRQTLFLGIGEKGQRRLGNSCVAIVGCGALGTIIATSLVRAGVGKVKIIDRDFIEYHNLQRQVLFNEEDIREGLPKAVAAECHLRKVNSLVDVEGIVADFNYTNAERLIAGADLILDGLDNLETRLLINDVSLKHHIPWIYGGAIASYGATMNIIPSKTACFRCLYPTIPLPGSIDTCDTVGVIGPAPFVIGSLQSAQAMKILVGAADINQKLILIDVWKGSCDQMDIATRHDCPTCSENYEFLDGKFGVRATSLCGQNAVQVSDVKTGTISFKELETRLKSIGEVKYNEFMLHFKVDGREMVVFPDGRAIVKNTSDVALAKGLYAKYIGV